MHVVRVLVGIVGVIVIGAASALAGPATQGGVENSEARLAWYTQIVVDAYGKVGKQNPRWDANARKATAAAIRAWTGNQEQRYSFGAEALEAARAAQKAGCDDAMILYIEAWASEGFDTWGSGSLAELYKRASDAMQASQYAAIFKARALYHQAYAARNLSGTQTDQLDRPGMTKLVDQAIDLLPEVLADEQTPLSDLDQVCRELINMRRHATAQSRKIGYDMVDAILAKARPESYLRYLVRGRFYTNYAYDARGTEPAFEVTEEQDKRMRPRAEQARKALEKAWQIDRTRPEAPTEMLVVQLLQGNGRDMMELWFARAMKADPNNWLACWEKARFLGPWYYGSDKEMVDWGHELIREGNWDTEVPLKMTSIHWSIGSFHDRNPSTQPASTPATTYWQRPEVWKDVKTVFEEYLSRHPKDVYQRTRYLRWSVFLEQWVQAKVEFDILGDKPNWGEFSREEYAQLRQSVSHPGGRGAGKPTTMMAPSEGEL